MARFDGEICMGDFGSRFWKCKETARLTIIVAKTLVPKPLRYSTDLRKDSLAFRIQVGNLDARIYRYSAHTKVACHAYRGECPAMQIINLYLHLLPSSYTPESDFIVLHTHRNGSIGRQGLDPGKELI